MKIDAKVIAGFPGTGKTYLEEFIYHALLRPYERPKKYGS